MLYLNNISYVTDLSQVVPVCTSSAERMNTQLQLKSLKVLNII